MTLHKKTLIYFALGSLLMLPACNQETPVKGEPVEEGTRICFRSYLPTVDLTRAEAVSVENFTTCQVTCFSPSDTAYLYPGTDAIRPYFEDVRFEKRADGLFFATRGNDCRWPDTDKRLHFFAYAPAAESLWTPDDGEEYFRFVNETRYSASSPEIKYRMEKFRVATDIADQVDFVTAYTSATLTKDADEGIELTFRHQLARVELSAWSGSDKYEFEIAGVRIGNPLVEADYDFSALTASSGKAAWLNRGKQAPVEHIFTSGERVVSLSKRDGMHASEKEAASIMGNAGAAMVIPMEKRIEAWEGKNAPDIKPKDYTTDRMYFSVLLRVRNMEGEIAYPYPNDRDNMAVVYLTVAADGTVRQRVYKYGDLYYTADEENEEYLYKPEADESIRAFGWAALPLPANWEAGKIYAYSLNYTDGIGWHDPSDPNPGEPIIERGKIPFEVSVEEWVAAEGYDPAINVPKR